MQAGRLLDSEIAKLRGWRDVAAVESALGVDYNGINPEFNSLRRIPEYSMRIEDAWTLAPSIPRFNIRLADDGKWKIILWLKNAKPGFIDLVKMNGKTAVACKNIEAETAPLAICKAVMEMNG